MWIPHTCKTVFNTHNIWHKDIQDVFNGCNGSPLSLPVFLCPPLHSSCCQMTLIQNDVPRYSIEKNKLDMRMFPHQRAYCVGQMLVMIKFKRFIPIFHNVTNFMSPRAALSINFDGSWMFSKSRYDFPITMKRFAQIQIDSGFWDFEIWCKMILSEQNEV